MHFPSPLSSAQVSGHFALGVVRAAREMGINLRELGEASGIGDLATQLPETISVVSYLSLLETAAKLTSDPLFGLHAGEYMRVNDAAGYSMVLLACRDIRLIAQQTIRYESLSHDLGRSELIECDGVAYFRWHTPWLALPGGRHLVESMVACIRACNDWLAGTVLPIFEITFTHAAPVGVTLDEYERVLLAPVRFNAEFNEGSFPSALLDMPIPNADVALMPAVQCVAEQRLQSKRQLHVEPLFVSELRAQMREKIKFGQTSLNEIAAVYGLGMRTLQRRLANAGVSYSKLLDDVRRGMAQEYLVDQSMSLTEMAFLLGYNDQSSFIHAFRRWFGMSPSSMRRQLVEDS